MTRHEILQELCKKMGCWGFCLIHENQCIAFQYIFFEAEQDAEAWLRETHYNHENLCSPKGVFGG